MAVRPMVALCYTPVFAAVLSAAALPRDSFGLADTSDSSVVSKLERLGNSEKS